MTRNLPAIRLALMICLIALTALILDSSSRMQARAQSQVSISNDLSVIKNEQALTNLKMDDLKEYLDRLDKHMEFDDVKLAELQDDQHTWKGIVVGIGSVIAILELLQALGFARRITRENNKV